MKQSLTTAFLASVVIVGLAPNSQASGLFRRCRGCESDCVSAAPAPVQYEERKVIRYKPVMKEKEIEVLECKRITRDEKYTYTVSVPVTKEEKRKVIVCTPTTREEDCTFTVLVPKTVEKKIRCVTYQCTRETVIEKVPVCRTVCVTRVDECGRCYTCRERVTVMEERSRCIVKRIPITEERTVHVTICVPEIRKGKRTVCDIIRTEKEITVNVCSFEHHKREGVRTVCEFKTEKVKRKVQVCELEREEVTVRVPVCSTSCGSECGHGRSIFFRRCSY
jgi:hypothetical protein